MRKIISIILLIVCIFTAVSCNRETASLNNGITIKDDVTEQDYSDETRNNAKNTIKYFIEAIAKISPDLMASSIMDRKDEYTNSIEKVLYNESYTEKKYNEFFEFFKENIDEKALALKNFYDGKNNEDDDIILRSIFKEFFAKFGTSSITGVVKGLIECNYDFNIESYEKRASQLSPALAKRYKELAELEKNKKDVFVSIDDESINAIIKTFVLGSSIVMNKDIMDSSALVLSSDEIVAILNTIDFEISLSIEQWEVLFDLVRNIGATGPIFDTILKENDTEKMANFMNGLFNIFDEVNSQITPSVIEKLNHTESSELVRVCYNAVSNETKTKIDNLFEFKLSAAQYKIVIYENQKLNSFFDVDNHKPSDLANATPDEAYEILRGSIRGIFYD